MELSLCDRLLSFETLHFAWRQVESRGGGSGGDGISISRFAQRVDANLLSLIDDVRSGSYHPGLVRTFSIRTGAKYRRISILPVRDRILQRAALDLLTPLLDPRFLTCSYGYRPNRSRYDAIERITRLRDQGLCWVIDADIRDCFGSLDHALLTSTIRLAVSDLCLQRLLISWINPPPAVIRERKPKGILLGAPISPLFCNLYLHKLDHALRKRGIQHVRYADDFVVFCQSDAQARHTLRTIEKTLAGLNLLLNQTKTNITTFNLGFDYLGVHFEGIEVSMTIDDKRIVSSDGQLQWLQPFCDDNYF